MRLTPAMIAVAVAASAALGAAAVAVMEAGDDQIAVRSSGQPIVTQRRGDRIRMCWPEVERPLLTDAQFLGGELAPEVTTELQCTGWR